MSIYTDSSSSVDSSTHPTSKAETEQRGDEDNSGVDTEGVIDQTPSRVSIGLTIGFALVSAVLLPTTLAIVAGLFGAILLSSGAILGSRSGVHYGTVLLLAGVAIAGIQGSKSEPVILSTLFALLAWDSGRYGIRIGNQLGRDAETVQIEIAHTALNTAIGVAGAGLGYATYRMISGGQSVAALALLLFGALLLLVSFR